MGHKRTKLGFDWNYETNAGCDYETVQLNLSDD